MSGDPGLGEEVSSVSGGPGGGGELCEWRPEAGVGGMSSVARARAPGCPLDPALA